MLNKLPRLTINQVPHSRPVEPQEMNEKDLLIVQGIAFFLLIASSIISLNLDDYSSWAMNLILAMMVVSAGNVS